MLGDHCIKTWSATQGAIALSSAEAEFYAMIEAVIRAEGVLNVVKEIGCTVAEHVQLFADSSVAESFVSRRDNRTFRNPRFSVTARSRSRKGHV